MSKNGTQQHATPKGKQQSKKQKTGSHVFNYTLLRFFFFKWGTWSKIHCSLGDRKMVHWLRVLTGLARDGVQLPVPTLPVTAPPGNPMPSSDLYEWYCTHVVPRTSVCAGLKASEGNASPVT